MKIGFLWASKSRGFYPTESFENLYKFVGHNNGNLAFVYALENQFKGSYRYIPWHTKPEFINKHCDVLVIPCANQLGKHTDLGNLAKNLSKVECPIIAIGLGAQAKSFEEDIEVSEGTHSWLRTLIENGQKHGITNIYTRGPYTTRQIKRLTGVDVVSGGCPSHFISPNPRLGEAIETEWQKVGVPRTIAVAGGHQSWANVREIEHQLISLMMDPIYPGIYIPQSMGDMIKISRNLFDEIDPPVLERIKNHTVPHYTLEEFKAWANRFAKTYYDIPAWADDLRRMDLVIGARYHGCAIAIQTEKMACTIAFDSRTEEMCIETGVPYVRHSDIKKPITRANIKQSLIKFDAKSYDEHRMDKCKRYVNFCESAGLIVKDYLHKVAGN